jgi:hypothetical protein
MTPDETIGRDGDIDQTSDSLSGSAALALAFAFPASTKLNARPVTRLSTHWPGIAFEEVLVSEVAPLPVDSV